MSSRFDLEAIEEEVLLSVMVLASLLALLLLLLAPPSSSSSSSSSQPTTIFVCVLSAAPRGERRQSLRSTWFPNHHHGGGGGGPSCDNTEMAELIEASSDGGDCTSASCERCASSDASSSSSSPPSSSLPPPPANVVGAKFFVGDGGGSLVTGGDTVVLRGVDDSYAGLPEKVTAAYSWILDNHPEVDLVLRVTDDVLVDLPRVVAAMSDLPRSGLLWGKVLYGRPPIRDPEHKNYLSEESFPGDVLPDYAHGAAYAMSRDVMAMMSSPNSDSDSGSAAALRIKLREPDDVFAAHGLALLPESAALGLAPVLPVNEPRVFFLAQNETDCVDDAFIVGEFELHEVKRAYDILKRGRVCEEFGDMIMTRVHYRFGDDEIAEGRAKMALWAYQQAVGLDSNCYKGYYGMGLVYYATGDKESAIWAWETCLGINPGHDAARENLDFVLEQQRRQAVHA